MYSINKIKPLILSIFTVGFSLSFIIKGIASLSFFLLLSISFFYFSKNEIKYIQKEIINKLALILFLPFFINILNNIYYFNFIPKSYDYSVRFFLSIPILFLIIKANIDINKFVKCSIHISILLVFISFFVYGYKNDVFNNRAHTYFVDPNTLGVYIGAFLIFLTTSLKKTGIISFIAILFGLLIFIFTETRSAWITFIIIYLIFLFYSIYINKINRFNIFLLFLFLIIISFIYQERFLSTFYELIARYHSSSLNSSIGDRISLNIIAYNILKHYNIFLGVDINNIDNALVYDLIKSMGYSASIYDIYFCCGFHSQYATLFFNYGILGLTSYLLLLFFPIYLCIKNFDQEYVPYVAVFSYFSIVSLGLDILNLKYTQSIFLFFYISFFSIFYRKNQ